MAACMAGKGPETEIKCKIKWQGSLKKRNKIVNFAIKAHYGHAVRMREVQMGKCGERRWGGLVSEKGKVDEYNCLKIIKLRNIQK